MVGAFDDSPAQFLAPRLERVCFFPMRMYVMGLRDAYEVAEANVSESLDNSVWSEHGELAIDIRTSFEILTTAIGSLSLGDTIDLSTACNLQAALARDFRGNFNRREFEQGFDS